MIGRDQCWQIESRRVSGVVRRKQEGLKARTTEAQKCVGMEMVLAKNRADTGQE